MQLLLTICPSETRRRGWQTCCFFSFLLLFFLDLTRNMLKGIFMEQDCKSCFRWFQFISWIIHLFLFHTVKKCLTYKIVLFWIMFATASPVLTSCQICPITRCICVFADAEIFSVSKGLRLLLTGITLIKFMPSLYCSLYSLFKLFEH